MKRRATLKRYTPLKKFTATQRQRLKAYGPVRTIFLEHNPECLIRVPGCTHVATQVHHSRGRTGAALIDIKYFKPACDNCHHWAEDNPAAARDAGVSESRF